MKLYFYMLRMENPFKRILILIMLISTCIFSWAQDYTKIVLEYTADVVQLELWPNGAPNNNGITASEIYHDTHVQNVTKPTLTVYVPKNPKGLAVLACPGGSYHEVCQGTEGHNMANWYNAHGFTYAVLKYRLPNGHYNVPLSDVNRAMKIMKKHNIKFKFKKIGVQGCSAGGHLVSSIATHYTCADERPDFQVLFYPVISFNSAFTHMQSRDNFIGKHPSDDVIKLYSNETQVTADTPPALIFASSDDEWVPVRNSVEYYNALGAHNVAASLMIFPTGGHGWFGVTNFVYRNLKLADK